MTLRHLKIYLAVYRTENITRAAETLCMTQPAVTRAIQEIENYYGVQLFDRINRRLSVTETGKLFYSYALHILDAFDQMEKSLKNWEEFGILRIGVSITIGNTLLPHALLLFRQKHPALQIRSLISNGARLQQAILDNQLDFALIEGSIWEEQLHKEEIGSDRLVLIMHPEDPRKHDGSLFLKDFEKDSFLLREKGSMGRNLIDQVFSAHGIALTPMMESVSTQAIIHAVHAGLGISFLPEQLALPAITAGYVSTAKIQDETFNRQHYLVWHRQKLLTPSAKELISCFRIAQQKEALQSWESYDINESRETDGSGNYAVY